MKIRRAIAALAIGGATLGLGVTAQTTIAGDASAVTSAYLGNGYDRVGPFKTMASCKTHRASTAKRYNLSRSSCHQLAGGYFYTGRAGA